MLEFPKLGHTFYNQETEKQPDQKIKIATNACAKKGDAVENSSSPFVPEAPTNLLKKR